jgi:hypothetical protein
MAPHVFKVVTCGFVNIFDKVCVRNPGHAGPHSDDVAPFHQAAKKGKASK